ncbi:hypothetical protein [Agathobaculum butyriciproducens]
MSAATRYVCRLRWSVASALFVGMTLLALQGISEIPAMRAASVKPFPHG